MISGFLSCFEEYYRNALKAVKEENAALVEMYMKKNKEQAPEVFLLFFSQNANCVIVLIYALCISYYFNWNEDVELFWQIESKMTCQCSYCIWHCLLSHPCTIFTSNNEQLWGRFTRAGMGNQGTRHRYYLFMNTLLLLAETPKNMQCEKPVLCACGEVPQHQPSLLFLSSYWHQ